MSNIADPPQRVLRAYGFLLFVIPVLGSGSGAWIQRDDFGLRREGACSHQQDEDKFHNGKSTIGRSKDAVCASLTLRERRRLAPRTQEKIFFDLDPLVSLGATIFVGSFNELAEERMRLQWLGLEFWVELAAEEERVSGNLDDLDVGSVGRGPGQSQSSPGEQCLILSVEFVTMPMAFADLGFAVGARRHGTRLKLTFP